MRAEYAPRHAVRRFVEEHCHGEPDGPCVVPPYPPTSHGRLKVTVDGVRRTAHSYATELRLGPPSAGMVSCHDCDEPNCIIHTRWGTQAENVADMVRSGAQARGERIKTGVLGEPEVRTIRAWLAEGVRQTVIAARLGINQSSVSNIATRRTWRHI